MRGRRILTVLAALAVLTGCAPRPAPRDPVALPALAPGGAQPSPRVSPPDRPAPAPDALVAHYRDMERRLLARGLMRSDTAPTDAPVTAASLARNFLDIALHDEYRRDGGQLSARKTETRLHRWRDPVRFGVVFGDSVPSDRRAQDQSAVAAYAAQLAQHTRHPVALAPSAQGANFHVLFIGEQDRRAAAPLLRALIPGLPADLERTLTDLPPDTRCAVVSFAQAGSWETQQALAIIRDEHRGLMRQSCIHEELAQGLGLANDSPHARPSIFNDDSEFALLTGHDAALLRMLYDPRLRAGMTLAEARALALPLARALLEGES